MKVKLDRSIGWKGQAYSGECEIPDDLAIVLGYSERVESADPTPKPKTKRSSAR